MLSGKLRNDDRGNDMTYGQTALIAGAIIVAGIFVGQIQTAAQSTSSETAVMVPGAPVAQPSNIQGNNVFVFYRGKMYQCLSNGNCGEMPHFP
jgi:hypothetical protein